MPPNDHLIIFDPQGDVDLWRINKHGDKLRMRVSSRQMTRAFPPFRQRMDRDRLAATAQRYGRCEIELAEENGLIGVLLNIAHGRDDRVSRSLNLQQLADVARLVWSYECFHAMGSWPDTWMSALGASRGRLPATWVADATPLWICISWVFRHGDVFRAATRAAVRGASGKLVLMPSRLIPVAGTIENRRRHAIEELLKALGARCRQLLNGNLCTYSCNSIIYGALTRELARVGINPNLAPPYHGLSFGGVLGALRKVVSPEMEAHSRRVPGCPHQGRNVLHCVLTIAESLEKTMGGLELVDFGSGE